MPWPSVGQDMPFGAELGAIGGGACEVPPFGALMLVLSSEVQSHSKAHRSRASTSRRDAERMICCTLQRDLLGRGIQLAREGCSGSTARGVDGALGAAARRGASPGPGGRSSPSRSCLLRRTDRRHRLEPRHTHSRAHLEPLQDLSRSRIDSPQIALVTFPGSVPELSADSGDPGDEAVGLDGAKNRPCLGIDLMDLPVPPHPEHPSGPREPRDTAAAGRLGIRGEHTAGLRIDPLVDAHPRRAEQVLAVEGRSCMRGDINPANRGSSPRGIEGIQLVSGSKPDVLTVIRDPMHVVDTRSVDPRRIRPLIDACFHPSYLAASGK